MFEACYSTKLLSLHLDLPLDTIISVCLQFGLLSTDLHLLPCAGLSRLSTWAFSSCSSSARAPMSSANRRLVVFLPPMLTFPSCSLRKTLKRVGERRHHCLTYCSEPFSRAANHLNCTCSLVVELLNGAN